MKKMLKSSMRLLFIYKIENRICTAFDCGVKLTAK